ncbi:hypothetical protein PENTCL1PPCAC_14146, partial [Pristionchus entomophagus]
VMLLSSILNLLLSITATRAIKCMEGVSPGGFGNGDLKKTDCGDACKYCYWLDVTKDHQRTVTEGCGPDVACPIGLGCVEQDGGRGCCCLGDYCNNGGMTPVDPPASSTTKGPTTTSLSAGGASLLTTGMVATAAALQRI